MYEFSGEKMASNSESKTDRHAGGDQQEKGIVLSSVEDEHLINERGDYGASTKSTVHDITKELIANESEHNIVQSSEPATQSSYTLSTIMSTGDSYDNDGKMRSAESSDSEILLIDEGQRHYLAFSIVFLFYITVKNMNMFFYKCYS